MSASNSLSLGSATGNPRNKVALKPGRSLMDWIRLGHSGKDLTGVGGKPIAVPYHELEKHNKEEDAWICLKGIVYNISHYMEYHPGGISELMKGAGKDATQLFLQTHQWVNYESMLQKCLVGQITGPPTEFSTARYRRRSRTLSIPRSIDLVAEKTNEDNTNVFYNCNLCAKYRINYNTKIFKLKLPTDVKLKIPIGHHLQIRANIQEVEVVRNYTPIIYTIDLSRVNEDELFSDYIYLMIKIYQSGSMTSYLDALQVNDEMELGSQISGDFNMEKLQHCKRLYLLAAGTGLTPMIRIIQSILTAPDKKNVTSKLLFFNRDEKDILWQDEFNKLVCLDLSERLEIVHILSEPHENWNGKKGHINKMLLEEFMITPFNEEDFCCVCGPKGFMEQSNSILHEMQFSTEKIHLFQLSN